MQDIIRDTRRVALLAAQLPRDSRCAQSDNPDYIWDDAVYVLRQIDYDLQVIAWMFSDDGSKGKNAPMPPQTPKEIIEERTKLAKSDKAFVDKILGFGDEGE